MQAQKGDQYDREPGELRGRAGEMIELISDDLKVSLALNQSENRGRLQGHSDFDSSKGWGISLTNFCKIMIKLVERAEDEELEDETKM